MVTISKFSYENPRYINLFKRRSSIPEEVETTVKEVLKNVIGDCETNKTYIK